MECCVEVGTRRGRRVVTIRGDVDVTAAEHMRDVLERQVARNTAVFLDCSEVGYIDARGLGSLICARYAACAAGVRFQLLAVSTSMRQVLSAAGIGDFFPLLGEPGAAMLRA